jgi:hypothetical protein
MAENEPQQIFADLKLEEKYVRISQEQIDKARKLMNKMNEDMETLRKLLKIDLD